MSQLKSFGMIWYLSEQLSKQLQLSKYKLGSSRSKNKNDIINNDKLDQEVSTKKDNSTQNKYIKYILNYLKKSLNNVLDSFEINISNVHIRFEDPVSPSLSSIRLNQSQSVCCLGFLLNSMTIISPNLIDYQYTYDLATSFPNKENSKSSTDELDKTKIGIEKLIEIRNICVYCYSVPILSPSCVMSITSG